jgi:hypothetical protein
MKSLEIKSSTTTGKLERKYRKVRSEDKAASAMENNKRVENMSIPWAAKFHPQYWLGHTLTCQKLQRSHDI